MNFHFWVENTVLQVRIQHEVNNGKPFRQFIIYNKL